MTKQIQWGIIGCGNVTEAKSGPAFNRIDGSKLVAVMRRNGEKARDYAMRHGVPKWYDDAAGLINDPDVNAVYIATPPGSHREYTLMAAEAGKPVYVEKPMALNYQECKQMLRACASLDVPLFVAYYRRCLPNFVKIKELLDNQAIGDVRFVHLQLYFPPLIAKENDLPWRVNPAVSGGGLFYDLGSHQLDLLDHFFGPVSSAKGQVANQAGLYPAEDLVCASFAFSNGVLGTGIWCFSVSPKDQLDKTEIVGSKGKISFSFFDLNTPVTVETETGTQVLSFTMPAHVQQPLIQTIVEDLQDKGKCPSTGSSAARTARVMDDIMQEWKNRPKGR
jgi:predicted dehydrogenase